mmetsp:Transcript_24401/g.49961  ORF Transcript_24401/g.49961 Transcript_24401/m.49961 type:complete len:310 (+) Transcript_24401:195-1124(+)
MGPRVATYQSVLHVQCPLAWAYLVSYKAPRRNHFPFFFRAARFFIATPPEGSTFLFLVRVFGLGMSEVPVAFSTPPSSTMTSTSLLSLTTTAVSSAAAKAAEAVLSAVAAFSRGRFKLPRSSSSITSYPSSSSSSGCSARSAASCAALSSRRLCRMARARTLFSTARCACFCASASVPAGVLAGVAAGGASRAAHSLSSAGMRSSSEVTRTRCTADGCCWPIASSSAFHMADPWLRASALPTTNSMWRQRLTATLRKLGSALRPATWVAHGESSTTSRSLPWNLSTVSMFNSLVSSGSGGALGLRSPYS